VRRYNLGCRHTILTVAIESGWKMLTLTPKLHAIEVLAAKAWVGQSFQDFIERDTTGSEPVHQVNHRDIGGVVDGQYLGGFGKAELVWATWHHAASSGHSSGLASFTSTAWRQHRLASFLARNVQFRDFSQSISGRPRQYLAVGVGQRRVVSGVFHREPSATAIKFEQMTLIFGATSGINIPMDTAT
jgi:hypothetical protein